MHTQQNAHFISFYLHYMSQSVLALLAPIVMN